MPDGVNKILHRDANGVCGLLASFVIRNVPHVLKCFFSTLKAYGRLSTAENFARPDMFIRNMRETRAFLYCSKYVVGWVLLSA